MSVARPLGSTSSARIPAGGDPRAGARSGANLHLVSTRVPALSDREVEVLLAWLAAESKSEAADALFISASTVNTHLTRIRAKYSAAARPARSKASLFARAIQDGYTTLDEW
ncbi:response regulator transcription factor [Williamsia sp. CHRR-6]|uniref:response regulator transcription factor n=1 Tax=Williamsia sp. CHRR-6 TaxID=2835871 RepID=UPI001BD94698|nr:helix-turn-helix domain-containing protein [Williamsia sp. CHRR-6]MBT0565786.1 helix-turn-helix domain-containing protein [Williamsia sp. CHRR-6]